MNPYRQNAAAAASPGRRWGATWLVRILTRSIREQRAQRRTQKRLCWEQMAVSAGFLYALTCSCGQHSVVTDGNVMRVCKRNKSRGRLDGDSDERAQDR